MLSASSASPSSTTDEGAYRFATLDTLDYLFITGCAAPACTSLATTGAYTSDYAYAQVVYITGAANGETWEFDTSNSKLSGSLSLSYNSSTDCWTWTGGGYLCGQGPTIETAAYFLVTCQSTPYETVSPWTFITKDNGTKIISHGFGIAHNPAFLGITSPTDNRLLQLLQSNYTTGAISFSAGTNLGGSISWSATLQYATSGGKAPFTDGPRTFNTTSGVGQSETYGPDEGGQVQVTAQITNATYGTIQDCTTFYVEGPETGSGGAGAPGGPTGGSGIPDTTITYRLDYLYPNSNNYPSDGTGTQTLMTGLAMKESSYKQFLTPAEPPYNPDLFDLWAGFDIAAKWPLESQVNGKSDGGSHIGLMQFQTAIDDAWNWQTNTNDGVNDTGYGFSGADLPHAKYMMSWIINGNTFYKIPPHPGLAQLSGNQHKNMALVLYGPFAHSTDWTKQYYAPYCTSNLGSWSPVCPAPGVWAWTVNDGSSPGYLAGNPFGVNYANCVRNACIPYKSCGLPTCKQG